MSQLTYTLSLAAAGAAGTLLRCGCNHLAIRLLGAAFPWGTLAVNVAGSFAFGVIAASARGWGLSTGMEGVLLFGLLGGFTTYSSFAFQSAEMIGAGRIPAAVAYIAVTNVLSLAAVWAGLRCCR